MVPPQSVELIMEAPDGLKVLKSAESPHADTDGTAMETVDAAAVVQVSPASTRSSAAMQSLMEQGMCNVGPVYNHLISEQTSIGGRVDLIVSKRDSGSPVLTRTIGDPSTGTHVTPVASSSQGSPLNRPPLENESSSDTTKPLLVERPTFVELPSPRSFTLDCATASSSPVSPQAPFGLSHSRKSSASPTIFDPGLEVLVVDDDPLTRMLMKRLLSRLGCNVSTAENGEMALDMILGSGGSNQTPSTDNSVSSGSILEQSSSTKSNDSKYHIIFLDNQMPVLSGLKTIGKLRELRKADFVVGVTGEYLCSFVIVL
jgi:osomolarity two-component system, sensor histidine kinase SLN1